MATVSDEKYYNTLKVKRKPSMVDSYTFNSRGEVISSSVVNNFLFMRNQTTHEYKKLFPVNQLQYLDFELLDDGNYIFIIRDYTGLVCQIRNFEKGTLETYKLESDGYANPSIIIEGDTPGIFYSNNEQIFFMTYVSGKLSDKVSIKSIPGEYLEYSTYDKDNLCVKLVTKVFEHKKVHPNIPDIEKTTKEYTDIPLTPTLEKLDV